MKNDGYKKISKEKSSLADGQNIRSIKIAVNKESSFAKEIKFMFISDICVSQLHVLHLDKGRDLIKVLDERLIKDREEYTWFDDKKYVDISYELKKFPPEHVLRIWLDLRNAYWE